MGLNNLLTNCEVCQLGGQVCGDEAMSQDLIQLIQGRLLFRLGDGIWRNDLVLHKQTQICLC